MNKFAIFVLGITLPLISQAQQPDSLSRLSDTLRIANLPEVSVRAYRLNTNWLEVPMSLTNVGELRLQTGQQQLTLTESLAPVPGVYVQNTENFAQDLRISIRGYGARSAFGIRGIKILQDGFPESTPDGSGQVDNIDPGMLRSVEVLRGAASVLYGNSAGGAVDFQTLRFESSEHWKIGMRLGSYDFRKYQIEKSGGKAESFLYHLQGSYTGYNGFREHSESTNYLFNGGALLPLDSALLIKVVVNFVHSPVANDPGSLSLEDALSEPRSAHPDNIVKDVGEHVSQGRVGIQVDRQLTTGSRLQFKGYFTGRRFGNKLPTTQVDLDRTFAGLQGYYEQVSTLFNQRWTYQTGVELEDQSDDRRRYINSTTGRGDQLEDQTERFTTVGAYFLQKMHIGRLTQVHGGLRYDFNRLQLQDRFTAGNPSDVRNYQTLNPMIGLSFTFRPAFNLFINYATAFETPTLNELDLPAADRFNELLEPQKSRSLETGLKGMLFQGGLTYGLAWFRITTDNEITPRQEPEGTYYDNTGATTRTGCEFSLHSLRTDPLVFDLTYTWSDFVFDEQFPDNRIPGIPRHLIFMGAGYQPEKGPNASVQFSYTGRQYADNENEVSPGPWWLVNLLAGYTHPLRGIRTSFFLGVKNLFDEFYYSNIRINGFGGRYYEPAPGRYWFGGITIEW